MSSLSVPRTPMFRRKRSSTPSSSRSRSSSRTVRRRLFPSTVVPVRPRIRGMVNGDLRTYNFVQKVSTFTITSGLAASSGFVNGTTTNDAYIIGAATGTPATPAFAPGAFAFCLNDLDQATSFSTLFQEYRINMVKMEFVPVFNQANIGGSGTKSGELFVVHDFEDNTAVSDLTGMRQRQDTQIAASYEPITFVVKPRILVAGLGGTGSTVSSAPNSGQWISCAVGAGIAHYGCKYAISNMSDTTVPKWIVRTTYYVQFRAIQ